MSEHQRLVSVFDALGPVMTGPSSSHTAGMVRIGKISRILLGDTPERIELSFYGALALTYKGHFSDSAIVAGLLGMDEDSPGIVNALDIARNQCINIKYQLNVDSDKDPNTVEMFLSRDQDNLHIEASSIGGGEILVSKVDEFSVSLKGDEDGVMFVATDYLNHDVINSLLGDNLLEIQYCNSDTNANKRLVKCLTKEPLSLTSIERLKQSTGIEKVFPLRNILSYKLVDHEPLFSTLDGFLQYSFSKGISLPEAVMHYEMKRSGIKKDEISQKIRHIWETMNQSVKDGLSGNRKLIASFIPSDDPIRMLNLVKKGRSLSGDVIGNAIANALAAMVTNGSLGCVVAAPTAGSCGVMAGALVAACEKFDVQETEIEGSLLVGAMIGTLVAMRAPVSGAMGGCQSEIGVASAMTAASLVQLAGGTAKQVVHAFALVMKNILGLVCDPVGGPVEIPCIKRNAIGVATAFAGADMALAGIESAIPPDEVITALVNVQKLLPFELRGSMMGGLASTPTANILKNQWRNMIQHH
ncbi:L-serine ammonia-lyase, iron-sulfur-dependent, subunit alpha [Acetomicrobium sp.]|uniref:L-serine ammonia-lyase, iron-sulfur-dependent, subunit alpha n=1 Tax=Acetomicrobium sp. TaxID=1872099 RepID=UPI002B25A86D|nr:L-serine ammonia-lyase, iron-sulfur-dependent, subunit alpha [Acetomicrobium sp.]